MTELERNFKTRIGFMMLYRKIHLVRPISYQVKILEDRCKGCQLCTKVCPRSLLKPSTRANQKGYLVIEWEDSKVGGCMGCGTCYEVCPEQAIRIYAQIEK